jgi:MFS family permease
VQRSADVSQMRSALAGASWSPWRAVIGFGVVSLSADMVYEGARSITGPLLASLGASAVLVGLITGAGEAMALLLRVIFGSWADRTGRYWTITYAGYAVTAVCVPLMAITPFLASAGLALACFLILTERFGKAVRSPAKTALLAHAAGPIGLGRGMGVHKALDQVGAVSGPLLVAAVAAVSGALWPALAVLIIPGTAALLVLSWIRRRMGDPVGPPLENPSGVSATTSVETPRRPKRRRVIGHRLPAAFWLFASAAGAATAGLVTFGVISYHLTTDRVVPVATIPLIYAAAMAAEALAALATGGLFDRIKGRTLLALPFLVAAVPALAFSTSPPVAILGVVIWGCAMGIQDSTVKALVADLVPSTRRATAYGVFAAVQGAAAIAGGAMAGALYQHSLPILITTVAVIQIGALVLIVATLRVTDR